MTKPTRLNNNDVNWNSFNPELYLRANYVSILPPDREILKYLVSFYKKSNPSGEFVEIGSGPNLYPIFAALPYAKKITILELGKQNIAYLEKQFDSFDLIWHQWINLLKELDPIYSIDFHQEFINKVIIESGSLFDLPENKYQLASMHFVAESVSQDLDEFYLANKKFALSLMPKGIFSASFMEGSEGYSSPGSFFPAVHIISKEVKRSLKPFSDDLDVLRIQTNQGIVREGHTGMLLALGSKK